MPAGALCAGLRDARSAAGVGASLLLQHGTAARIPITVIAMAMCFMRGSAVWLAWKRPYQGVSVLIAIPLRQISHLPPSTHTCLKRDQFGFHRVILEFRLMNE